MLLLRVSVAPSGQKSELPEEIRQQFIFFQNLTKYGATKFQGRCFKLINRKVSVNFVFSRFRGPPAVPNIPENPNYRGNSSIIQLPPNSTKHGSMELRGGALGVVF